MKATPRQIWTLARAESGLPPDGTLDELPPDLRAVASALQAGRKRQDVLSLRPDSAALSDAMDRADVQAPAPGAGEAADGWPALRLVDAPEAAPFPVDVLPGPVADLVRVGAESIDCPPEFFAVPCLVTAAGAIGRSVSLMLKHGYFARASLYVATIGPPSDGKSPAMEAVTGVIRIIDECLAAQHAAALASWEASGGADGKGKSKRPPGAPPRPVRIDVEDTTTEALALTMADNPRGLLLILDELSALVAGLNQYKSKGGTDKQVYLKTWSGKAIKRDRVLNENGAPIRVPHPCLSILGGMPPDVLPSMMDPKGRSDGWIDRFLFAFPEPRPVAEWSDPGLPDAIQADWTALVQNLWDRPFDIKDGEPTPHVNYLVRGGRERWKAQFDAHAAEMNAPDFPPHLRGPWGKFREYAGRLALVLALMHHAADPTEDQARVPDVDGPMVDRAWKLIGYFKSHARRVHGAIAGGPASSGRAVRAIVAWLREDGRAAFTERDISQARRWIDPDDLAAALKHLTDRGAIRRLQDAPTGGRPRSPSYEVNPALLATQ